jgi:hypothetical protein
MGQRGENAAKGGGFAGLECCDFGLHFVSTVGATNSEGVFNY